MGYIRTLGLACLICTISFIIGRSLNAVRQSLEYKDKPLFLQSLFSVLSIVFMLIGFPYWGIFEVLTWEANEHFGAEFQRQDKKINTQEDEIRELKRKINNLERELEEAKEACDE